MTTTPQPSPRKHQDACARLKGQAEAVFRIWTYSLAPVILEEHLLRNAGVAVLEPGGYSQGSLSP